MLRGFGLGEGEVYRAGLYIYNWNEMSLVAMILF